jgi:hypothetical protein
MTSMWRTTLASASVALLVSLCARASAGATPVVVEARVCSAALVPEAMRGAHAQFSAIVRASSSASGSLADAKVVSGPEWLDRQGLLACIGEWRASGLPGGAAVTIVLNWKWGAWVSVAIGTSTFRYSVDLQPQAGK